MKTILSLGLVIFFFGSISAQVVGKEVTTVDSNSLTITLSSKVVLELKKIPAGTFTMGSPEDEQGRIDHEVQHRVTITKAYWMGVTEVTQAQWNAVMGGNPAFFQKGDNYPVEQVSWKEARRFCEKLNNDSSIERPEGYCFDLPTEAQWEYSCRAGTTGACYGDLDEVAWYDSNSGGSTHPVAQKHPNLWGLYDMHGNVCEWCRDWWWWKTYQGNVTDPMGPTSGSNRVIRGGSWCSYTQYCRAASRIRDSPDFQYNFIGFRLALVPVP